MDARSGSGSLCLRVQQHTRSLKSRGIFTTDVRAVVQRCLTMTVAFHNDKGPSSCRTNLKKASIAAIYWWPRLPRSAQRPPSRPTAALRTPRTQRRPSADPASGTVYTGDVIEGKKVVSALDVNDLEPGKKHLLYFQGVEMPTGQHWYVSVTVAKGANPGKRGVLTSGVHGDEMSSIHTVQTVMNQLDPAQMSGTVMAVTDVSRPAIESMQRRWPNQGRGPDLIDMNREWPGNENGFTAPSRHAGLVFNRLLRPNADFAIDFHTGTTGFELTAFNIGETARPEVKAMLDLYPVGQIFDMPKHAYPSVLHNAFLDVGIPSFCPEIGAARHPGHRDDRAIRGRHDERAEASRHRCRAHGAHGQGRDRLCRQQYVPDPGDRRAGSSSIWSSSTTRSSPDRRWPSSATASAKWLRSIQAAWPERSRASVAM